MSKVLGVIPARYGSSRLPGKPLADICGKPMIQWVYERTVDVLATTVVATDDQRIYDAVEKFGGIAVMTSKDHISGTLRVAEVAEKYPDYDYYINIQGDQPLISRDSLEDMINGLYEIDKDDIKVLTLVTKLSISERDKASVVKISLKHDGSVLTFSRRILSYNSYVRGINLGCPYLKHLGLYGFTKPTLEVIKTLPISCMEKLEKLEQMTWLYHDIRIETKESNDTMGGR